MADDSRERGPFRIVSTQQVYANPWIRVREDRVVKPGGQAGVFGVVEMVAGSSVLPLCVDGTVLLVEEYKYSVGRTSIEVISGAIEPGETPLLAAQRELHEEIGYTANAWTDLGLVDPFTSLVASPNHVFLAQGLVKAGPPTPDPGEQLRSLAMPLSEALHHVLSGRITHAASCIAILKTARILGL